MPPGGASDDAKGGCFPGAFLPCFLGPGTPRPSQEKRERGWEPAGFDLVHLDARAKASCPLCSLSLLAHKTTVTSWQYPSP